MDKTTLVAPDLQEGRKFLELLGDAGVPVQAALWQKSESFGRWELLLVTKWVEEHGVKGAYRRIDEVLRKTPNAPSIDLLDVSLYTPEARFYKSLHRELRNARDQAVTMRPVGDHFIDDGFIYFVK